MMEDRQLSVPRHNHRPQNSLLGEDHMVAALSGKNESLLLQDTNQLLIVDGKNAGHAACARKRPERPAEASRE